MNLKELLLQHAFPQSFIDALTASGITTLHPPQAEAIRKGVLDKKMWSWLFLQPPVKPDR